MSKKTDAIKEELSRFQHTKNTFSTCERLLRTATFSGAECEQVAQCLALMKYMIAETSNTIKQIQTQPKSQGPSMTVKAPESVVGADETLGAHIPGGE